MKTYQKIRKDENKDKKSYPSHFSLAKRRKQQQPQKNIKYVRR